MAKKIILSFVSICLCFSLGCAANPITGEEELMFSRDYHQDIEMGKKAAPEVEKELKGKIPDQELQNYIGGVGKKVAQISHNPDFDFHFVAVNDKSINAVSLPGGYIFITKGMLVKLTSESQLAGILAHEVVHVVARDAENMMSKQAGMGILVFLAMSQTKSPDVRLLEDFARQILELRYSREDEKTADIGGLDYMVRAGYNPSGIIEAMQMLEKEDTIKPAEFFSTHPSPENRIDYLKARIQTHYPDNVEGSRIGQEDYHRAVLEKLKILPDTQNKKP